MATGNTYPLLVNATAAPTTGTTFAIRNLPAAEWIESRNTYQAILTGTGAISATVLIEVSNDEIHWVTMATFSMSGTTTVTEGFSSDAPWAFVRAKLTAITGTGAAVSVIMGV